jgi:outer membrane protein assembly factor BamA
MKNLIYILASILLFSCDENEILPRYEKKGTATATVAAIEVSNDEPEPGEKVTITLMYVNPTSDPVATVELRYKVGSGNYSVLQTFDENTGPRDETITREINYVAPDAGTAVTFDMVITSQKEYPQIMRVSIEVSD